MAPKRSSGEQFAIRRLSGADRSSPQVMAPFGDVWHVGAPVAPVATFPRGGCHRRDVGEPGAAGLQFSSGKPGVRASPPR
jgi:hypothetical protein